MINEVLFDLDGTLTEPFEGITNAIIYALRAMGRPVPERDTLRPFIGPPLTYSFENFLGMTESDALRAVALYREYYSEKGIFECRLYDGVTAMLDRLRESGRRLFMATSKPQPFAERIASSFGFADRLDGIAGASFDKSRAEKDDVLAYAIKEFGVTPASAAMVGDRKYDISGAIKFGLLPIGVLYGYGSREELETAGAKRLAAKPKEIADMLE